MNTNNRDRCRMAFHAIWIVLLLAAGRGCLKDAPETLPGTFLWNPEIALPLGEASFGMNGESGFDTLLLRPDPVTGWPEWVDEAEIYLQGTMDFDLSRITDNPDLLNRILFRVNIHNGFPDRMLAQAYFTDPGNNFIDSLFAAGPILVPAGTIRNKGETIVPATVQEDAIFEKERIGPLRDATGILMHATLLNPDPDTALIPYYPSYGFDVQVGAMIDVSIQF
ncbi:MAG: hypothetical protein R6U78_05515 [Bacteroidales bacterium]